MPEAWLQLVAIVIWNIGTSSLDNIKLSYWNLNEINFDSWFCGTLYVKILQHFKLKQIEHFVLMFGSKLF